MVIQQIVPSVQCHSFLVPIFFLSRVLCYVLVNGVQRVTVCE